MIFFAKTDLGKRRQVNQDYAFATDAAVGALPNLFLLADGMGGHKAGDYASRFLVEELKKYLGKTTDGPAIRLLDNGIHSVGSRLHSEAQRSPDLSGMGTTLVACVIEDNTAEIANVGDSRAYLIRKNSIRQVTKDHSYVEEMVARGYMRRGSEDYYAAKNIITRAVGVEADVEADFFEVDLEPGDYVLLCSDGLTNMVDDNSIFNIVRDEAPLAQKAEALIDAANINGGKDNIAVVLIDPFGEVAS